MSYMTLRLIRFTPLKFLLLLLLLLLLVIHCKKINWFQDQYQQKRAHLIKGMRWAQSRSFVVIAKDAPWQKA
ncbi:hypothetical protein BX666DRAFT_1883415 [Dichotomocladium elegans]|nr:hypothetical protein BX666DRAFT_1883415 [Dichotomocladium elegans]